MRRHLCAVLLLPLLHGCTGWFFSGESWVDRSRPVVLVETIGGVELGAATEFGVLTLGRTATEGPCRVHYFLGPTPMADDGLIVATGSTFARAEIDLKTQLVRVMDHTPSHQDELVVMWTPDGTTTESVAVRLATGEGLEGDVLENPGEDLPPGAAVLHNGTDGTVQFVGLIAGKAMLAGTAGSGHYYVFAGVDRIRELLAVPSQHPQDLVPKYRPDDITVMKPLKK